MLGGSSLFRQMMGFDPFAGMMMEDPFANDPFFARHNQFMFGGMHQQQQNLLQQQEQEQHHHYNQQQQHRSRRQQSSDGGPIIEEPDSDDEGGEGGHHHHRYQQQQHQSSSHRSNGGGGNGGYGQMQTMQMGFPGMSVMFSGPAASSFSFSSTSMSTGNGGVTYSKTSRMTMGPGGVIERQEQERDGRTGQERIVLERRLGDRGRRVTKQRDRSGREETEDHFEGLSREEAATFDQQWQQAAAQSGVGSRMGGGVGRQQQPRYAMLQNGGGGGGGAYDNYDPRANGEHVEFHPSSRRVPSSSSTGSQRPQYGGYGSPADSSNRAVPSSRRSHSSSSGSGRIV